MKKQERFTVPQHNMMSEIQEGLQMALELYLNITL